MSEKSETGEIEVSDEGRIAGTCEMCGQEVLDQVGGGSLRFLKPGGASILIPENLDDPITRVQLVLEPDHPCMSAESDTDKLVGAMASVVAGYLAE